MSRDEGLIRPYSFALIQLNRVLDAFCVMAVLYVCAIALDRCSPIVWWLALGAALTFMLIAQSARLYRSWRVAPLHEELSVIWKGWLMTAGIAIVVLYLIEEKAAIDRTLVILWACLVPLLLSAIRVFARLSLRTWRRAGRNFRVAAIVGATTTGQRVAKRILLNRWMGMRIAGIFDDRSPSGDRPLVGEPTAVVGNIDDLAKKARAHEIDIIYIALPMRAEQRVRQLVERLEDCLTQIYYVPDFSVFDLLYAQWETLGEMPILRIINSPHAGYNGFIKRIQDIILSGISLLILAIPMLGIAWAIRLTSPGPAIYRQVRHGLDGREFVIYKFRSMATAPQSRDEFAQATKNDARVTRLGRFLRRTSLDELPQLINVLQGRMSLVGPRPHPLKLNNQHSEIIKRFVLRHKVRPGITGWAQVNGFRGETETLEKMRGRIEYDLEYINNWSLWLDVRILAMTAIRVWQDPNAY